MDIAVLKPINTKRINSIINSGKLVIWLFQICFLKSFLIRLLKTFEVIFSPSVTLSFIFNTFVIALIKLMMFV